MSDLANDDWNEDEYGEEDDHDFMMDEYWEMAPEEDWSMEEEVEEYDLDAEYKLFTEQPADKETPFDFIASYVIHSSPGFRSTGGRQKPEPVPATPGGEGAAATAVSWSSNGGHGFQGGVRGAHQISSFRCEFGQERPHEDPRRQHQA